MAKIINIEKSKYLNENIGIYTSNKVGQYSKFLDKNPMFVTWLHINSAQSRSDVGTGGVDSDVGPHSPVRFNQINNLPTFNIPELKPNTDYGENGFDVEMEISDAVLLPSTIIPTVGDYFILKIPDSIEIAFRVNTFEYNTIQSNDFYTYSADLKYTGHDLINKFKNQIVEEYETIFENIGTDDKCFILKNDVEKIQNIGKIFNDMRDAYYTNFFDPETGTFSCKNNSVPRDGSWLYDRFVERFIMNTQIYYTENDARSVVLTNAEVDCQEDVRNYMQTMFYAVENRTLDFLAPYPFYYQTDIQKSSSPFKVYDVKCKGVNLVLTRKELVRGHSDAIDSGMIFEYFSHLLIHTLLGIDEIPEHAQKDDENASPQNSLTYLDEIVLHYLKNETPNIDRSELLQWEMRVDNYTYIMIPLVLYIVMEYYNSYFHKEEL